MSIDRRGFLAGAAAAASAAAVGAGAATPAARPAGAREDGLCDRDARELLALLARRELSARELMAAHLERIRAWNPTLNAIVARLPDEECLALAAAVDERRARGAPLGALAGLPWAFKDLEPAVGFTWSRGSTIFRDERPAFDSLVVERLRHAGVVPIGKTNTPEFGLGSHSYNRVYGTTLNPYDPTKSAGGSSGGAGAALATGMLALADGSDLGGSLRNPANFNNVVGFRPSVGLVPTAPTPLPFYGFAVKGPMARTVSDVALLLSVLAGPDVRDPGCLPSDPAAFAAPLGRDLRGSRVAWCPDLGGLPLEADVRAALEPARATLAALGCVVEDVAPDLAHADEVFLTLRALRSWIVLGPLLERHRDELKPEAVGEIEAGRALGAREIGAALAAHGALVERMREFHARHDFIACAVNQLAPFDARLNWPKQVAGVAMEHYVAWMKSAYWITATWQPAISVPAGFTAAGLPVGLQLVGRRLEDRRVLELAYGFEQATRVGLRRPPTLA
ncbi:MAG TPA: amidase [Steroidobacteraceae bacterium]|nr:amidase [Steroidobacteraceae bacterium]